jgi:hypothetical protein
VKLRAKTDADAWGERQEIFEDTKSVTKSALGPRGDIQHGASLSKRMSPCMTLANRPVVIRLSCLGSIYGRTKSPSRRAMDAVSQLP